MDDQATSLLIEASGIMSDGGRPTDEAKQHFSEQFGAPLHVQVVGGMRSSLGLPVDGGIDRLCALAHEGDVHTDA